MNNPYESILTKENLRDSLRSASQLSQEQLEQFGTNITDEDFERIQEWAFDKIKRFDVQSALYIGGLLTLVRSAAYLDSRMDTFYQVIEDLDISLTKAYDSIAVFRCFGKQLLEEEVLMSRFPLESLKILSASGVSDETRQKAIVRAVTGKRITIKEAKLLIGILDTDPVDEDPLEDEEIALHQVAEIEPANVSRKSAKKSTAKSTTRKIWSFSTDDKTRLVIETKPDASDDANSIPEVRILEVLEAAIEQYRRENDSNQEETDQPDAA